MSEMPNLDRYLDPEQHERATSARHKFVWCNACKSGGTDSGEKKCKACGSCNLTRIPR
jgi:hypothetical protein